LLQEEYPNIEVKTYQIPAQEVSQLRTVLGEYDIVFKKSEKQGAFSHVVDASLVLATALQNAKISEELTTTNTTELSEKGQWLKDLLPKNAEVVHIKRKPKYRKKLESYSLCLACCFSLALYNFLSKSLTVFLGVFLGVFNGSISWQLSNAKP
jgi:hypothetical protein